MDFNDDRSNFSNSQMALDLQNVQQTDYHQSSNYDDLLLLQYLINDDQPNYGSQQPILNQCEQPNNSVLLTNPQSSNSLKAQNSAHSSQQQQTNLNNNRSRINQTPHHFYQSQNQQQPPQFHNQTSTSKQFQPIANNLSNIPINQQINYVNIPNKDDSLMYSDVVNHNPCNLNNQIYNKKDMYHSNRVINNNGVNHQLQHPQMHSQMNNLINKNTSYSNDTNLSSPNNITPIKNNNLLIKNTAVQQQQRQFYSPPNYQGHHGQNNSLQTNNNLQQQQTGNKFINNGLNYNFNDTNSNANNTINNNSLNNNNTNANNVKNNLNSVVDNVNLVKLTQPKIQDSNQTSNLIIDNNNITQNNLINNSNSINSNLIKSQDNKSQLNELNKVENLDNRIINQGLKIDNKINIKNDKTIDKVNKSVDNTKSPTIKTKKAETKTVILIKIIDQVFLDGNLVKETIIKDEEVIKDTGTIDWPIDEKLFINNKEQNPEVKNKLIKSSEKLDKNLKKTSPKTNLKRSIKENSSNGQTSKDDKNKEKKVKTEMDHKLNDEINSKSNSRDVNLANNNTTLIINNNESLLKSNNNHQLNDDIVDDKKEKVSANNESVCQATKAEMKSAADLIDEPVFIQIENSQKIYAKWSDKNWYSGVVLKQENDKYKIKFDDGASRSVREEEILNIEFIPKLQTVMFFLPSSQGSFCGKGVIKSYRKDELNNQKYYLIEQLINNEKVETEYRAEDVFLTSEAGLALISKRKQTVNDSKFADVDLNNIIPRSQRTRVSSTKNESSNHPNTINDKASTPLNSTNEIDIIDNDSNSNLSNSTTSSSTAATVKKQKKSKSVKQQHLQVDIISNNNNNISLSEDTNSNLQDLHLLTSPLSSSSTKSNNDSLDLNSNDDLFDLLGPILKNNSSLFKSFAFLISCDEQINSVEQAGFSIPFDLNHLIKQIKSGSGKILEKFEDIKDNYQAVLISHSFAKTIKYITALSLGIPCVKYTFIIDSCKKNELVRLEDYILPLGYSILSKQLIQDRTIYKKSQTLFKGTKIYLISTDTETTKWLPLLKACKMIILDKLPENLTRKQNFVDFIVSDKTCPSSLVITASNLKIPIVSIEYIIASLIHGKKLSVDIHPTFKHNYTHQKIDLEKKN